MQRRPPRSAGRLRVDLFRSVRPRSASDTALEQRPSDRVPALRPFALAGLAGIGVSLVAVALVVGTHYGYHRDELYFLACAKRLAWGYVDQPPLTPAVARLALDWFGSSLPGLRLFPALAGAATVVAVGALARELGGGRFAQLGAAALAAVTPLVHSPALVLSTASFDQLVWVICFLAAARMLRTGNTRLWYLIGTVAGIGLLNKYLVVFLLAALVVGFTIGRRRDLLLCHQAVVGLAIAVAIWSPNLLWQAHHGWPVFAMSKSLQGENAGLANIGVFFPGLIVLTGVISIVLWVPGLWWLLRSNAAARFRPLGIAVVVVACLFPFVGGKPYYLAPAFTAVFAATGVFVELHDRLIRRAAVAVGAVAGLATLPASVPVLPASMLGPILHLNGEFGEMYGWPELTDQIAAVYGTLPESERTHAVVLTGNYGEHGAAELYGPSRGLPPVYSGHNSDWSWGPPPSETTTVVAVGIPPQQLAQWFHHVRVVRYVTNREHLANEELGEPIVVATDPVTSWATLWPEVRTIG